MKVLMVEPGAAPYEKELNGLHEMQAAVGGLIQAIYPFEDKVAVVCDDEGMLKPNEFNRSMPGGYGGVFGPFFVCGLGEDDFTCDPVLPSRRGDAGAGSHHRCGTGAASFGWTV